MCLEEKRGGGVGFWIWLAVVLCCWVSLTLFNCHSIPTAHRWAEHSFHIWLHFSEEEGEGERGDLQIWVSLSLHYLPCLLRSSRLVFSLPLSAIVVWPNLFVNRCRKSFSLCICLFVLFVVVGRNIDGQWNPVQLLFHGRRSSCSVVCWPKNRFNRITWTNLCEDETNEICREDQFDLCQSPLHQTYVQTHLSFYTMCDGIIELLPITIDGSNYTDETECVIGLVIIFIQIVMDFGIVMMDQMNWIVLLHHPWYPVQSMLIHVFLHWHMNYSVYPLRNIMMDGSIVLVQQMKLICVDPKLISWIRRIFIAMINLTLPVFRLFFIETSFQLDFQRSSLNPYCRTKNLFWIFLLRISIYFSFTDSHIIPYEHGMFGKSWVPWLVNASLTNLLLVQSLLIMSDSRCQTIPRFMWHLLDNRNYVNWPIRRRRFCLSFLPKPLFAILIRLSMHTNVHIYTDITYVSFVIRPSDILFVEDVFSIWSYVCTRFQWSDSHEFNEYDDTNIHLCTTK